jgi:hypothetical protein
VGIYAKLKVLGTVAKDGDPRELGRRIAKLMWSAEECYILRRDLSLPINPHPRARMPVRTRPLAQHDIPQIIAEQPDGILLGILQSGIRQCYVAVTNDDEVCYMQWLISPEHRAGLQSIRFRQPYGFDDDSVVLEFAYTFRRFRGLGIMADALTDIAAEDKRARWAWTYVPRSNVPCLRGCHGAGFLPYRLSHDRWRLFFLRHSIEQPKSLEPFWGKTRWGIRSIDKRSSDLPKPGYISI